MVWLVIIANDLFLLRHNVDTIPYSQFIQSVDAKKVADVSIGNERIFGTFQDPVLAGHTKEFTTIKVDDPTLTQHLMSAGVKFSGFHESTFFRDFLSWVILAGVIAVVWSFFMNRMQGARGGGLLSMGKSRAKIYAERGLKTKFEDVAGVDEAKEELTEIVSFLRDPGQFTQLGGRMPKGVLLVGPPGTGKTLLARAVAGEAGVPFFSINGSEFVELFVGLGAARVRDLFEQARAQAPCIIFIDELDALGKVRGISAITGSSNDEKEQTLNQLLAEMDGFDTASGIVLLAATNRPEVLDPALLRAGRFDRHILVDKPDRMGRIKILQIHLKQVKMAVGVNVDALAGLTAGFSGADLSNLVNEAALMATRRKAASVELRDFNEAIERVIAGPERRSRLVNAAEKRRVAFHEMGHAVVALALGEGEEVHKVSVIPRGIGALGYTLRRPTEDRFLMSKRELEFKMAIMLGGRASEVVFFDDISTGAVDDLDKATEIARAMITRYGMSASLGLAVYEREPSPLLGAQALARTSNFSEETARVIDEEIKTQLAFALKRAIEVVRRYSSMIEEAAQILIIRETIDEPELKSLWNKHQLQGPAQVIGIA